VDQRAGTSHLFPLNDLRCASKRIVGRKAPGLRRSYGFSRRVPKIRSR
jgi:hypothetical protein